MRRALLLLALLLCLAALPARADTGTYEILDYRVTLTPHANGTVAIDYYQRWRVTGGHIPWITVGLPNEHFAITGSGGAVRTIAPQNQGSWSGVRIDLDRDYQPGQTFEVSFSVTQNKLFYAEDNTYKLDFWPGWYDRAVVDSLTIALKYFVKPESITADPAPTSKTGTELVWSGLRLGEGERYTVHVSFPKASAPQAIPQGQLRPQGGATTGAEGTEASGGEGASFWFWLIVFAIIGLLLLYLFARIARSVGPWYSGGGLFYPGGGDDDGGLGGGHGDHETGGGGGFGGSGFSCACACACVSCACACACAGGGGAGCSRKLHHSCPQCEKMRGHVTADA